MDEDYAKFDMKAMNIIQVCLAHEVLQDVLRYDSATKLWEGLKHFTWKNL